MDRLERATPELSDDQRRVYFGSRTQEERDQLADVFETATPSQRFVMYSVLREWAGDMMAVLN